MLVKRKFLCRHTRGQYFCRLLSATLVLRIDAPALDRVFLSSGLLVPTFWPPITSSLMLRRSFPHSIFTRYSPGFSLILETKCIEVVVLNFIITFCESNLQIAVRWSNPDSWTRTLESQRNKIRKNQDLVYPRGLMELLVSSGFRYRHVLMVALVACIAEFSVLILCRILALRKIMQTKNRRFQDKWSRDARVFESFVAFYIPMNYSKDWQYQTVIVPRQKRIGTFLVESHDNSFVPEGVIHFRNFTKRCSSSKQRKHFIALMFNGTSNEKAQAILCNYPDGYFNLLCDSWYWSNACEAASIIN